MDPDDLNDSGVNMEVKCGQEISEDDLQNTNQTLNLGSEECSTLPERYEFETVDVPSSPSDLKATGFPVPIEISTSEQVLSDEDEDTSIFQAQLSSNCQNVKLVKDPTHKSNKNKTQQKRVINVAHELLLSAKQLDAEPDSYLDNSTLSISTMSPLPDCNDSFDSDDSTTMDCPSLNNQKGTADLHSDNDEPVLRNVPGTTESGKGKQKRVISVAHELLLSMSQLEGDTENTLNMGKLSPDLQDLPDLEYFLEEDDSVNPIQELTTRRDQTEPIPELTAEEEAQESRSWRRMTIDGSEHIIDLRVVEPYKRVISHAGYLTGDVQHALIVLSGCYLPDRSRVDYDYVMSNLFLYVMFTLNQLVTDNYVLIYLHGATPNSCVPRFKWLKHCYQMINRRLRKNLKGLYLVHPTFLLKSIVFFTKPFISSKFSKKLFYIPSLSDLFQQIPVERSSIPHQVKRFDYAKFGVPDILEIEH